MSVAEIQDQIQALSDEEKRVLSGWLLQEVEPGNSLQRETEEALEIARDRLRKLNNGESRLITEEAFWSGLNAHASSRQ